MIWLQYWLFFVAAARLLNVVLGYLGPIYFKERVYTLKTDEVSALAARLFSVWTALTCACCIACALFITERGIFVLTYLSFIIALGFFATEYAIYRTVPLKFLFVIMGVTLSSLTWMTIHWNATFAVAAGGPGLKFDL